MKQVEFLDRLSGELTRRHVADAAEILEEYRQHFTLKLADGYSEEEIAAKLGDPAMLAGQFAPEDGETVPGTGRGRRMMTAVGLGLADLLEFLVFTTLLALGLVLTAAAIAFAGTGVCLLTQWDMMGLIPTMPYAAAVLFGLALLALGVLAYTGCVWYGAYLRQSLLAFFRFHSNTWAAVNGGTVLPPVPSKPQLPAKRGRRLRRAAQIAVTALAVLLAGDIQFWHVWGWFGYGA